MLPLACSFVPSKRIATVQYLNGSKGNGSKTSPKRYALRAFVRCAEPVSADG
jgi:hypothetical protein